MPTTWTTRPETAADIAAIREVNLTAFATSAEADLVQALCDDPAAWLPGLSWIALAGDGAVAGPRCSPAATSTAIGPLLWPRASSGPRTRGRAPAPR